MSDLIIPDNVLERIEGQHPSLIGSAKDGRRQISLTLLTPPSSSSSRSVSSSSSTAAEPTARYITIPTHLESSATFEFLGFTPDRATELYEQLASRILSARPSVLECAQNWVKHICAGVEDSTDNWDFAMEQAGIKDEIKTAFADPKHSHILHVQSLSCWLSEIMETSFNALTDMSENLLTKLSRPQISLRGGGDDPYTIPQAPGGHIALFKSVEYGRCQGCISEDGTVDLTRLLSTGPTDFCHRGGLYFTHQMWVATHYSALINDACSVADRRTVEIHVPLAHFQSAKMWELQFEDVEFKQLLFYSRREEKYPKDLSKKRSNYGVINAPICHAHNKAFRKMESWTEITSKHQLQSKEEDQTHAKIARQHVWIREEAVTRLEEDIFGKAYLRKPEQEFRLIPQPWLDASTANSNKRNFQLATEPIRYGVFSFQIANAFPKYGGSIVALVTGAFDASAAVYLFYRLIYEASSRGFKPQTFFLVYLVVPFAIAIAQLTFLPSEAYKTAPQLETKIHRAEDNMRDVHSSDDELSDDEMWKRRKMRSARRRQQLSQLDDLVGDAQWRKKQDEKLEQQQEASGVWGALHNKSAREQMMTPWFILLTLLTVLQMIRMNLFIASIREQYIYMLNSVEAATKINDFFDWALPIGGVISTPFLGALLDNISTPGVLLILVFFITPIGIVGSIPALWAGYVNVILFVFFRPLYYSAMSNYATKVFGFATFGRVYGAIVCISGLVNLSQTGIDALTKGTFGGNPIPVNTFLTISALTGTALFIYVTVQVYRVRKMLDQDDAITVTNTDVGSVMESLLEEDEERNYGSIQRARPSREV